jgi:hypothetical protein
MAGRLRSLRSADRRELARRWSLRLLLPASQENSRHLRAQPRRSAFRLGYHPATIERHATDSTAGYARDVAAVAASAEAMSP